MRKESCAGDWPPGLVHCACLAHQLPTLPSGPRPVTIPGIVPRVPWLSPGALLQEGADVLGSSASSKREFSVRLTNRQSGLWSVCVCISPLRVLTMSV